MKTKNALWGLIAAGLLQLGMLIGSAQTNLYLFSGSETNITLLPGTYIITAYGTPGGTFGGVGGLGAEMSGEFNFSTSTTLTLSVHRRTGVGNSGGGGSFVVEGNTPLVIAGGGGGSGDVGDEGGNGTISTNGGYGSGADGTGGAGGTNGGGGAGGIGYGPVGEDGNFELIYGNGGGGGGGFLGDGTNGTGAPGGGGAGGGSFESGGFFGGVGGDGTIYSYNGHGYDNSYFGGGGGGGYSGGGGGGYHSSGLGSPSSGGGGGGGGSIIDSSAIAILTEVSGILSPDAPGNGEIIITAVPPPSLAITTNAAFGFTNGVFGFNIIGPAGSNVVIQASTDLKTWIPLQTNPLGSGLFYFSDSQSTTNVQRFYRAQLLP